MYRKISAILLSLALVLGMAAYFPFEADAAASGTGIYIVTSNNGLNMRSEASTSGKVLTTLPYSTTVRVTDVSGVWGYTSYNGNQGWISLDYARRIEDAATVNVFDRLDQLRVKFPAGSYWNHIDGVNNPDATTTTPCPCHPHGAGNPMASEGCTCNTFLGTFQCHGFSLKIGYDLFGTSPYTWTKRSNTIEGLCVGDIIRFGEWHTVFVTGISRDGRSLYICDGNWDRQCVIRWDAAFSMDYFNRYAGNFYVLHEPSNNCLLVADSTVPSVGAVDVKLSADMSSAIISCPMSDNSSLSFANVSIKAPSGQTLVECFSSPSVTLSESLSLESFGENGEYIVTVTAYDSVGNTASSSASFTVYGNATTGSTTTATATTTTTAGSTTTTTRTGATTTTATAPTNADNRPSTGDGTIVHLERLGGKDRIDTAIKIAEFGWEDTGARSVILANGYSFADALAGVPLAYALDAPILLTANKSGSLEPAVLAQIEKLNAQNIYILGGRSVISQSIEAALLLDYSVTRLSGDDRFQTAVKIADELEWISRSKPDEVFIAFAYNFPDALSASTVAALKGCPIVYVRQSGELDYYTAKYIKDCGAYKATVLGGTAVISEDVAPLLKGCGIRTSERIGGTDRYATSGLLCEKFSYLYKDGGAALATGSSFPDALAGAVLAAKLELPLVLAGESKTSTAIDFIQELDPSAVYVFGETDVVPDELVNKYLGF